MALAARTADVVFSVVQELDEARTQYAALKAAVGAAGRDPDSVVVLPGVMPVVGRTETEAFAKLAAMQGFVDPRNALALLSDRFGTDMAGHDLDGSVPDLPLPDTYHSFAGTMLRKARHEGMRLRDVYNLLAAVRGHWVLCGSAAQVAGALEEWFTTGAADGFNVMPASLPAGLDDFVDLVVPELQRRNLFRTSYEGTTLRESLNLPQPSRTQLRDGVA